MKYSKEELFQFITDLQGWCDQDKAYAIYEMIHKYKPSVGVEIGMFEGRSAIPAAIAMAELKNGKMYGVDPLKDEEQQQYDLQGKPRKRIQFNWEESVEAIHKKITEISLVHEQFYDRLGFYRMTSKDFSEICEEKVDYLHIDGNHSYEKVKLDCEVWFPKLNEGALICFDDLLWPTVQKAFQEVKHRLTPVMVKSNWGFYIFKG